MTNVEIVMLLKYVLPMERSVITNKNTHYARCCTAGDTKGKVHTVDEQPEEPFLASGEKQEWIVIVTVNETIIPFKLDIGVQANLLSAADSQYTERNE